jgi:KDO2-lipid IV(A) lauroyltransferase
MNASLRNKLEYSVFCGAKAVLKILPRKAAFLIGRLLGNLLYYLDKKHRRLAYLNLTTAFGDKLSPNTKKKIINASFAHFCQAFFDFIQISGFKSEQKDKLISVEGAEILENHLNRKKGILVFTAHFGLWEIAAHILSKHEKLNVIARPLDNPLLEKELSQMRANAGSHVIYKKNAARHALRALNRNEIVAVLIDQNVLIREGVFVQFFGKKASTTPSLALFFLRTEAPIIPIFCYPSAKHRYHLKIMEPPHLRLTGDVYKDVIHITQTCTNIIEKEIIKRPHLWLWFHDRWRSRPLDEDENKDELPPDF